MYVYEKEVINIHLIDHIVGHGFHDGNKYQQQTTTFFFHDKK